jgi:MoxR-like ATPase
MYFKGDGVRRSKAWRELPAPQEEDPGRYITVPSLVDAINVALTLSQPLLITGEPGTGKTQLGRVIAHELDLAFEKFDVKSDSVARDLFYSYDALARFHAAQPNSSNVGSAESIDPLRFIEFQALGKAILAASDDSEYRPQELSGQQRRVLVLIDEIDKAPRDLPNDLLNQIENMSFRIPEIGAEAVVHADPAYRPVVVITSNSEKSLPDAFLRRCAFYHIEFPRDEHLTEIVVSRLGQSVNGVLLKDALRLFQKLREEPQLRKKPGTAELLGWLRYLEARKFNWEKPLHEQPNARHAIVSAITTLAKDGRDGPLLTRLAEDLFPDIAFAESSEPPTENR